MTTLEPILVSIPTAADHTGESVWTVKQRLRAGIYRARKSGRRTLVELKSIKEHVATLPPAEFKKPRDKSAA